MAQYYQVCVTAADADEAGRLGRTAVEMRLAACAQVSGPITSTYWWHDEVVSAQEWMCVLKTKAALLEPLIESLRMAHSYETPEIIATAIDAGDAHYLAWVSAETGPRGESQDPGQ